MARRRRLLLQVRTDVIDRLLHRGDLLGVLVRNLGLEFLFQSHDELNRVQRVGAKVVDERRLILDLGFVNAELFCDDLLDSQLYVFQAIPPLKGLYVRSRAILPDRGDSHSLI